MATAVWGGTFGKVVTVGGHASDIALDEGRGLLYIANFTANRIEVMSTADLSIARSINVSPLPGSLALSPDGDFLVVTHYGNFKAPNDPNNALTVIKLSSNTKQVFALGAAPLAVAFGRDGRALLVTTADISLFDPISGAIEVVDTIASLASKTLPVPAPNFPPQITESSLAASADGTRIYGTTGAFGIAYDVQQKELSTFPSKGQPPVGPRTVGVSQDGSSFALGWLYFDRRARLQVEFPNPTGDYNVGSYAIDSIGNTLYQQLPEAVRTLPADVKYALNILDLDNLATREVLRLPENLAGKSILSSDRKTLYSVSDSGVLVMPVGALNQQRRVKASQEDVVFRSNACDKRIATQEIAIVDPGGGKTDFKLSTTSAGVSISPSSGTTPAKVRISIDLNAFSYQKGTSSATIQISSAAAVNVPASVRVLINNHEPDQRGTFVNVPGKLVDVLSDPGRDRFYVVRQDTNEILIFDSNNYTRIGTLRTSLTPTQMAITRDLQYLLVAHESAATVSVFDLGTLQESIPIRFPLGHIPRSIAVSNKAILVASHNRVVGGNNIAIDRVDFAARTATELPTLGPYENKIPAYTVLTSSSNGSTIFGVVTDGGVFLYSANADTFTAYRKDLKALSGAYAASNYDQYVVDNNLLNSSLVSIKKFATGANTTTGIAFIDQNAYLTTSPGASQPGVIQKIDSTGLTIRPTRTVESSIIPPTAATNTTNTTGAPNPSSDYSPFRRTLSPVLNRSAIISLTQSGFTVLPPEYDAAVAIPRLERIVNAADQTRPVAPGGLISIFGKDLSPVNIATKEVPLPTALAESCLTVNGVGIPLLLVSSTQINAQLPFHLDGSSQLVLRTPGGVSDNLNFNILPTAPSIFRNGLTGLDAGLATVYRAGDNSLVSAENPVRGGDNLIILATGLGRTSPIVEAGTPAPSDPLSVALIDPEVSLGGARLPVAYAGLSPGGIGIYQINVRVPAGVSGGSSVPLTVKQGNMETTLTVQVNE